MDDGYLHIYECPRVLMGHPDFLRCGFIQRGDGFCPYDHGEDVRLVALTAQVLCSDCRIPIMADDCRADDGRLVCPSCVEVAEPRRKERS